MSNREAAAPITAERGHIPVLNALEILERAALGPESPGTAAQFLKCLGEGGMLVIANPLVTPSAPVAAQPAASGVDAAMTLADEYARKHALHVRGRESMTAAADARESLRAHLSTALGEKK